MTGYERSPDYGGPAWNWMTIAVWLLLIGALSALICLI